MPHLHLMRLGVPFWFTLIVLLSYWLAQVKAANHRRMFNLTQMRASGKARGLPFLYHFCCMWSDLLVMPVFFAYIVQMLWVHWREMPAVLIIVLLLGHMAGAGEQYEWSKGGMEEAHTDAAAKLPSSVGIIHILQMGPMISIAAMFLLSAIMGMLTLRMFFGGACILLFQVILSKHWPLRLKQLSWTPAELRPMSERSLVFCFASVLLLFYGVFLIITV